jgi:predicted HTH transcriptional regulator
MWEDRRLRHITEQDVRQIVNAELEEHLQLEYKRALYENNDQGSKEFLQDICMFANSGGGILLIGISEQRGGNGQPTGLPDPATQLGIEIPNPEMVLQSYDARVVASIEECLPLESYAIPVANNRHVIAIRVPNSISKPHRVHYKGRTYFPYPSERNRY